MRKLGIILTVLAIATVALAQNLIGVTYYPTTQSAPSGDCATSTLGLPLDNVSGFQVIAQTDAGAYHDVFRGDGTIECHYCAATSYPRVPGGSSKVKRWARCNTAFDLTVDGGKTIALSSQFTTAVGAGRVYYFPNAVFKKLADAGVEDGGFLITIEGRKGFAR